MRLFILALVLLTEPVMANTICAQTREATVKPRTAAKVLSRMIEFSSQPAEREMELSCVFQLVLSIYPRLDDVDPNYEIADYLYSMRDEYPKEFRQALRRLTKQDAARISKLANSSAFEGGNG